MRQVEQKTVVWCIWIRDNERRHETDLRDVAWKGAVHGVVVEEEYVVDVVSFLNEAQIFDVISIDDGGVAAREENADIPIRCVDHAEESLHDMMRVLVYPTRPKPQLEHVVVLHHV